MKISVKIIKFIVEILCRTIFKVQYILHKMFPKHFAILSCNGCPTQERYDSCPYKPKKGNMICYYHTKKNRKI